MKLSKIAYVVVSGLVLTLAVAGCHKRPGYVTNILGARTPKPANPEQAPPIEGLQDTNKVGGIPVVDPELRKDWPRNAEIFKEDTVHFAFDSSVVRSDEKPKVAKVAEYLKAHPETALEIDGHCDERGTEEYNRSLGERRALALREEVVALGIDPRRIDTVTFGKDKPIATGHDEAAWRQNRRGEFLLETPPPK